jgi:hypothetical protein
MPSLAQDLAFIQAGLDELEAYLLSDELYWPLSGPAGLPRLTIGGLLLAGKRLSARSSSPADAARLSGLETRLDATRSKWRAAWENKSRREVHARLDLWQNYLADYRQSPETHCESYPQQVQWRVLLQLLSGEFKVPPKEVEILAELDKMMRPFWLPGNFVWELELALAFPEPEFWFLYGRLKS